MFDQKVDETVFIPDSDVLLQASQTDIAWVLTRFYSSKTSKVPAWTGFNQVTRCDDTGKCSVGYLPLINAPSHEIETLWTAMMICVRISNALDPGQSTVITLDQQVYCRAKELQWANQELCQSIFIRLGGFHIAINVMTVIGQHFAYSGPVEVWTESGVFGENTAYNNMQAKSYNRALRAHKLTFEAVWGVCYGN